MNQDHVEMSLSAHARVLIITTPVADDERQSNERSITEQVFDSANSER